MKKLKTWWLLNITGVVFLGMGILCFINPLSAYVKLVKYSGFALLVNGILLMLASSLVHTSLKKEKKWMFAESIIHFGFGILLVFNPLLSFVVFPFLIGYWIICVGVLKIIGSLLLRKGIQGWLFILAVGLLSCIFGILVIYVPYTTASDITRFVGFFGLTMGALVIFDSFRFRNTEDTLNMMF